jgi:hypothetical protein
MRVALSSTQVNTATFPPFFSSLHSLVLLGVSGNQRIRSSLEMCLIEHMLECIFVLYFFYGFSITREQL